MQIQIFMGLYPTNHSVYGVVMQQGRKYYGLWFDNSYNPFIESPTVFVIPQANSQTITKRYVTLKGEKIMHWCDHLVIIHEHLTTQPFTNNPVLDLQVRDTKIQLAVTADKLKMFTEQNLLHTQNQYFTTKITL